MIAGKRRSMLKTGALFNHSRRRIRTFRVDRDGLRLRWNLPGYNAGIKFIHFDAQRTLPGMLARAAAWRHAPQDGDKAR